jgi:murein DD-endopeptidase MepM/ murein hydrolase activator NlpD
MRRNNSVKRKLVNNLKAFGIFLAILLIKGLSRLYRFVVAKRTILFVSHDKIRTINIGPILQLCILLLGFWVWNLFTQSLNYDSVLAQRGEEIERLRSANDYFEEEFSDVNEKLKKINEYLISITGYSQNVSGEESNFKQPQKFKEDDLSRRDKNTLNEIRQIEMQLASIASTSSNRIKKIENAITLTGLNVKRMPSKQLQRLSKNSEIKEFSLNDKTKMAQGGPEFEDGSLDSAVMHSSISQEDSLDRHFERVKFAGDIDYLIVLEKLLSVMPFSKPMKNYYISSTFGARTDPLTHRHAVHKGLDFVGSAREKIISPSKGKVILAGRFSDYGNAIVIDHGFGITTRYGHLSEIKVKEGQEVKAGDVIAFQGSSGRSTGEHLHYEVRYKNTPLNPKKFLEAGESLLDEERKVRYVNS